MQKLAPRLDNIASLFLSVESRLNVEDQNSLLEGLFAVFNSPIHETSELPYLDRIFKHDDPYSCKSSFMTQIH